MRRRNSPWLGKSYICKAPLGASNLCQVQKQQIEKIEQLYWAAFQQWRVFIEDPGHEDDDDDDETVGRFFFLCNDTSLLLLVTLVNHQWWWWWQWWVGWLWCFWSQWWWCPPVGPPLHNGYGRHLRLFCLHFLWRTHTHAPQSTDNNTATDNPENSANIISWWTFFLSREVLVKLSLKQSNLPRTSGLKFANKST